MGDRVGIREQPVDATWDGSCKVGPGAATEGPGPHNGDGGSGNSDLERLIRLLTNEDTAEISDRQLVVLRQVCKTRQRG